MLGSVKILEQAMVRAVALKLMEQPEFGAWLGVKPMQLCVEAVAAITAGAMLEFFLARPDTGRDFLPVRSTEELDKLAGVPGFSKALWLSGMISAVQVPEEGVEVMRFNAWFGPEAHRLLTALFAVYRDPFPAMGVRMGMGHVTPITPCVDRPQNVVPSPRGRAEMFDEFWAAYPKKSAKRACANKYEALLVSEGLNHEGLMAGLARCKASKQWQKDDGQFIPNPLTWLNQGRWDDEPDVKLHEVTRESSQAKVDEQRRRVKQEQERIDRLRRERQEAAQ